MKIVRIHVDGFGVWCDRTWGILSPAVNVFYGPNEAGKTTLMAFVRSVLFGFERRGHPRRYEPLGGGTHGGWIDLTVQGERARVERSSGRHVRGAVRVTNGDKSGQENALDHLLGGTTRTLFHNVFAFGLEELEQFRTLRDSEIAAHISGAALDVGAARWTRVHKDLQGRQGTLYLPRGQNGTINTALRELDLARNGLDRTEQQSEEYFQASAARQRLEAEIGHLAGAVVGASVKVEHYVALHRLRPHWERKQRLEAGFRSMTPVERFPAGGVERLDLLVHHLHSLEVEMARKRSENGELRREKLQLASTVQVQDLVRRRSALETLRTLVSKVQADQAVLRSTAQRHETMLQGKITLESTLDAVRPPSAAAIICFILIVSAGAVAMFVSAHQYPAVFMVAAVLAVLEWYRRQRVRVSKLSAQLCDYEKRLSTCADDVRHVRDQIQHAESEIEGLAGRRDVSLDNLHGEAQQIEQLAELAERLRALEAAVERAQLELDRVDRQAANTRSQIQSLLKEGGAATPTEFIERAKIYEERQELIGQIESIPSDVTSRESELEAFGDEEYEAARHELGELERSLEEARHEAARIEGCIENIERNDERSRIMAEQESILARVATAAEEWAVLTLCRALLEETRKIYERERQPAVLRDASSFFRLLTDGRYSRVIMPLDSCEIVAERNDGARLLPHQLSRGTAEQLYLAMRLALIRHLAGHAEPMPVVFDDIFVNFDPRRTETSVQAVRELSSTHQVLLFTCHPYLVRQVEELVPGTRVFQLQ